MLSPLKPLLCRHDFYWSERRRVERCRRCGKVNTNVAPEVLEPGPAVDLAMELAFPETPEPDFLNTGTPEAVEDAAPEPAPAFRPARVPLSARALKAQARERREKLLGLLDRLADGGQPTRQEAIDAVLAVIEDAHSSEPVLFGAGASGHFARLHEARTGQAI